MIPVQWRGTTCPITHRALVMNSVIPVRIVSTTIRKHYTQSRQRLMVPCMGRRHFLTGTGTHLAPVIQTTFFQTQNILTLLVIMLMVRITAVEGVKMLAAIGSRGTGGAAQSADFINEPSFIWTAAINTM